MSSSSSKKKKRGDAPRSMPLKEKGEVLVELSPIFEKGKGEGALRTDTQRKGGGRIEGPTSGPSPPTPPNKNTQEGEESCLHLCGKRGAMDIQKGKGKKKRSHLQWQFAS